MGVTMRGRRSASAMVPDGVAAPFRDDFKARSFAMVVEPRYEVH